MKFVFRRLCALFFLGLSVSTSITSAQDEQIRVGSLNGVIGEITIDLVGVHAHIKPDLYSDLCTLAITTTPMDPKSVDIVVLVPCGSAESLVGLEYHPGRSEVEYLRVAVDFELDEQRMGGRYRTYWEAAGIRMNKVPMLLRLTDFDGEFLSGELASELPLRWLDGSLARSSRTERFVAMFQVSIEDSPE